MKKTSRDNRREFFLTFFDKQEGYEEKQVNGFWLIKCYNGDNKKWQVMIYSQESYKNYKGLQGNLLEV